MMSIMIDVINTLIDEITTKSKKNSKELAFDFICIKLRYQMRVCGMTNKEIKFEIDRIKKGMPLRPS